jgi:hypothetical protein
MTDQEKARLANIIARMRVTKVVATRSVKGAHGDTFVGFSAAFDTVQEDRIESVMAPGEDASSVGAMTLREAQLAALLLGQQADLAAYRNAVAGGNVGNKYYEEAVRLVNSNYATLLGKALQVNVKLPSSDPSK